MLFHLSVSLLTHGLSHPFRLSLNQGLFSYMCLYYGSRIPLEASELEVVKYFSIKLFFIGK